ncbi:MAG: hypothetical protein HY040_09820 [Planctomycetes bacterium]|nr:hypothetical protein [Planctomycetota bacterium]
MKCHTLVILLSLAVPQFSSAQDDPGRKTTIDFLQKLQQADGSFRATPGTAKAETPSLRATSSAIRALRYFGGSIPRKRDCVLFVAGCFDPETGGFADFPKGKPDVFTTAVGLMAVAELKMPLEKYAPAASKYLLSNAKSFDDIRIAVAGIEAVDEKPTVPKSWLNEARTGRNEDGTFGKGQGQARETASHVVSLLRLGIKIDNPDPILNALKAGQRNNGGYGKADSEIASDLETTYRVMRCFHMLKAAPKSVEGIRSFVAKCRNEDGGFGVAPGQPSSVSGTYFAGIILHWLAKGPK